MCVETTTEFTHPFNKCDVTYSYSTKAPCNVTRNATLLVFISRYAVNLTYFGE